MTGRTDGSVHTMPRSAPAELSRLSGEKSRPAAMTRTRAGAERPGPAGRDSPRRKLPPAPEPTMGWSGKEGVGMHCGAQGRRRALTPDGPGVRGPLPPAPPPAAARPCGRAHRPSVASPGAAAGVTPDGPRVRGLLPPAAVRPGTQGNSPPPGRSEPDIIEGTQGNRLRLCSDRPDRGGGQHAARAPCGARALCVLCSDGLPGGGPARPNLSPNTPLPQPSTPVRRLLRRGPCVVGDPAAHSAHTAPEPSRRSPPGGGWSGVGGLGGVEARALAWSRCLSCQAEGTSSPDRVILLDLLDVPIICPWQIPLCVPHSYVRLI